jgi:lipoprotein-anchoring transpeptidase ErfK/SrfK
VTATFLVATSIAAVLGSTQSAPQSALDIADGSRSDSGRVSASKPMPKMVAAAKTVSGPSAIAGIDEPAPALSAPAVPASFAVPLPDPALWSIPTATVPIPISAAWPTELPGNFLADSIVVEKGERRLTLYYRGVAVKKYRVALGRNPVGDKMSIGDYRTPEGMYYIIGRNPASRFYKSLAISYPDAEHEERAAELGVHPGGNIMIHGLPAHQAKLGAAHVLADWTEGCIAVTNAEIDELWRAVEMGAAIQIKP